MVKTYTVPDKIMASLGTGGGGFAMIHSIREAMMCKGWKIADLERLSPKTCRSTCRLLAP